MNSMYFQIFRASRGIKNPLPNISWRGDLEAPAADDRRAASRAGVRNKGLAPHRTNKYRNPRVKKKIKYAKAVVRRKGQVREMRNEAEGYGGEASGVRRGVGKSRRIT